MDRRLDEASPKTPSNRSSFLGLANYAEANQQIIPPYALIGPKGKELFGWPVALLPYLEGQGVYDQLNLENPWDDPVNQSPTSIKIEILLNPRLDVPTSESGYALSHYAANSQVFRPDKTWSLVEISAKDGLQNTILFGEIENHFQPWASPGSLRDPAKGLGDGPDQFGMSENLTVNFAFADGAVKSLSPDVDPKILKAWATPDGREIIPEQ